MRTKRKRRARSKTAKLRPLAHWEDLGASARMELRTDPDFRAAEAIHAGGWRQRSELQARILARQSTEDIAAVMHLSTAAIECYHFWFFHVRADLDKREAVMRDVVGYTFSKLLRRHEIPTLWKWLAFLGGLGRLEQLLSALDEHALQKRDVDAYLQPQSSLENPFKIFIAQSRIPRGRAVAYCQRRRRLFELLKAQHPPEEHRYVAMMLSPFGSALDDLLDSDADHSAPHAGEEDDGGDYR